MTTGAALSTPPSEGDPGAATRLAGAPVLEVDVEGFEGPLDMLLALARTQKVDLLAISIVSLADQFLLFVERARHARLELAADYLVMATWLALLKSRLLLPREEQDEPTADELAAALRFRLRRLDAMREAAASLVNRNRLERDVFARGAPEPVDVRVRSHIATTLYDLLRAYAACRQSNASVTHRVEKREVWSLEEARSALGRVLDGADWTRLDALLADLDVAPAERRSALATTFAAGLELVREGALEVQQAEPFAPLFLRAKRERAEPLSADVA